MYRLHKLSEGFIITSDEEIKEGYLGFDGFHTFKCLKPFIANETTSGKNIPCFYIELGSTSAFHETSYIKKVIAQQDQIDFSALSEEEQKEIGWFDTEKLAELKRQQKYTDGSISGWTKNDWQACYKEGFIEGFQKEQELSDRRFTLEDINKAITFGYKKGMKVEADAHRDNTLFENEDFNNNNFIQSLSQQSWSVELEMDCTLVGLGLEDTCKPKLTGGKVKILKLL